MDLDAVVNSLKSQVLGSLEARVYEQAVARNLVDTALRELVESAVEKLQVEMPMAASVGGALLGMLGSFAPAAKSLGLDQQASAIIRRFGVDAAMRDTVIRGLTRYLEENGAHLMEVAVNAAVQKFTRAG
jgi:hypothetical protein